LGAQVTVLEYAPRILPTMDHELAGAAEKIFAKQGLKFRLGVKVVGARSDAKGCVVQVEGSEPIACDRVLLAVGRKPNTDKLGLEQAAIVPDSRGRIAVNAHFETSAQGIYAIGDVIEGAMLAHKAEDEGVAVVEHMVTGFGHVDYNTIAGIVYTEPEIASVGATEEALKEAKIPYKKGTFPFIANGRARAKASTQGMVKILAHAETDRVLGGHIIGPQAGDLIVEIATAMSYGASSEDIARVCHPHPSLSEAVREAALGVEGRTLNL
jgi:dihydrolipoamide dehydrogenase